MALSVTIRSVLDQKGWGVFSVPPHVSVYEAVQTMADKDIGALAIVEADQLVGIFSERDYARKIILLGRSSRETSVDDVMSYPINLVHPDDTIEDCLRLMTTYRLRHLVVMQDRRIAGMVSIGDLMGWMISAQEDTIGHLNSYIASAS